MKRDEATELLEARRVFLVARMASSGPTTSVPPSFFDDLNCKIAIEAELDRRNALEMK